jgi:hypothetical protein
LFSIKGFLMFSSATVVQEGAAKVGATSRDSRAVLLERAMSALASLVRAEYPEARTLEEIGSIWGADFLSDEQVEALAWLDRYSPEG